MTEIDATDELDKIDDDRGKPDLGDKRRRIVPAGRLVLAASIAAGLGLSAWAIYHQVGDIFGGFGQPEPTPQATPIKPGRTLTLSPAPAEAQAATAAEPVASAEPEGPEDPPEALQLPAYGQPAVTVEVANRQPTQAEIVHQRRLSSPLNGGSSGSDVSAQPVAVTAGPEGEGAGFFGQPDGDSIAGRLQPLRLQASTAGLLPNRNYLITQGTQIGCVLETRIISTVPGLVVCRVTSDIWSESGNGILIDRGSKVVGQYSQGPDQGEERMFITWNRLIRPDGADIPIDSPAAGALGESGVPGSINNHYLKRFGGAILLSLLDDVFKAIGRSTTQVRGDGNQVSFTGTEDTVNGIAEKALESTINIRPTLILNQGSLLSITVARDLDFSEVDYFELVEN